MQVSQRVQRLAPSATLAVSARVRELLAAGADVIGFGAGEPDFDTPENIKDAAVRALHAGHTKYAPVAGELIARDAIAKKLQQENGIDCAAGDIVISVGGKHSIYLALQCLIDPPEPGERPAEVILPTPAWVSYAPMIRLAGGRAVEVPGSVDNDFRITPAQLDEAVTLRTRALIINTPSNPCGTMYTRDDLLALAEVLAAHPHVTIITDEMYEKLVYGEAEHFSLGSVPEVAHRVITIGGLSKAYAMTGWRIGYACVPGRRPGAEPERPASRFAKAMAKLQGQMTSNITSFCYPAIVEALTNSAEAVEAMRLAFAARAEHIHGRLREMPGVRCPKPTGAFYVFPDISAHFGKQCRKGNRIESAIDFATALLEEAGVAVVPGEDFGEIGRRHVRLSFACSEAHIEEGCRRLRSWIEGLR